MTSSIVEFIQVGEDAICILDQGVIHYYKNLTTNNSE